MPVRQLERRQHLGRIRLDPDDFVNYFRGGMLPGSKLMATLYKQ